VDVTHLPFVIGRRCVLPCEVWAATAFMVGQVVFRTLLWPLPGLLLYLIRLCFLSSEWSGIIDARGSEHTLLLTTNALGALGSTVLIALTFYVREAQRQRTSRRLSQAQSSVPNRTVGNESHPSSLSVVPDGRPNVHKSVASSYDVAQADGNQSSCEAPMEGGQSTTVVPGMVEAISSHSANGGIVIGENQLHGTEDEHQDETHLHVAESEETWVHRDEQPQLVETVVPVNGERSSPPETEVEHPASGAQGSIPGIMCMIVYTIGGQSIEHRVRDFDVYRIWDLKCLVGNRLGKSPYMIDLLRLQTGESMHDNLIVARLPKETQTGQLAFTAVLSKEHMREQMMLMGDCAPDDASMPSVSDHSVHCLKYRDDSSDGRS